MNLKRYMLHLSYLGTRYRGSQKHANNLILDIDSIQGAIEASLCKLKPLFNNTPKLVLAGRTDAGVHALNTVAHLDLDLKYEEFCTDTMIRMMNRYFSNCGHDIRIFSVQAVSSSFHARFSAISRTYVYRFIVPKDPQNHMIPISESFRAHYARIEKFDLSKVQEGIKLLNGTRDFTTFSSKKGRKTAPWRFDEAINEKNFIRTVRKLHIRLEEGQPLLALDPLSAGFDYWNIVCHSKSFMYNQVRRMAAALIGVGSGRLSINQLVNMLQVPSHNNWPGKVPPVPPFGLYLSNVEYDEASFEKINT
ncbi:hypothetical protein QAD02_022087 [Eretmocerus hayati]|uniref:Uncharacterized protein n=1 Tax=Eretmocerus hayati TaxID=131215 RepID=A0ACC2PTI0_9HYME|nr:hypothetical protein QAD02_022087 [Eretmocerus hayati]